MVKPNAVAFGYGSGIIGHHERSCVQSSELDACFMSTAPTMKDVAERAGVHHSTVSRVLSNSRKITESTRQRVLKAIEELGYRPNPYVSILMRSRSRRLRPGEGATIALVNTFPTRKGCIEQFPLLEPAFAAAARQAESRGFLLEEFWAPLGKVSPEHLSRMLWTRNITGVFLAPFPRVVERYDMDWNRFSAIAWGMSLQERRIHRVRGNHFDSVIIAMDECHKRGYRRVGLLRLLEGNAHSGIRHEAAYLFKQKEFGVINPPTPLVAPYNSKGIFLEWFHRERPDAILVERRPYFIDWLREEGIRIPEDLGVATLIRHSGDPASGLLATWDLQAIAGINFIIDLLATNTVGLTDSPTTLMVQPHWQEGETLPPRR